MSSDFFASLITDEFKQLHVDMIGGMLEDGSCTVKCRLNYRATKFNDCINCVFDPIGGKSSNRFQSGGPVPFHHGVCPMCNGRGKIQQTDTEEIWLMPIWDSKGWYNFSTNSRGRTLNQQGVNMADISVQTMSKKNTYPQLVRATSVVIDCTIENLGFPEFTRVGRPEICGLGQSSFIITSWTRKS